MNEGELVAALRRAVRVTVLTGAGISAESGIPTFREARTGLWARYRPEDLATPEAFERDPATVWAWYAWRRELVARSEPNAGHRALATLGGRVRDLVLITQNVDGLHQRAGSRRVIELHGNLTRSVCHRTGKEIARELVEGSDERPPRSPHAEGGLARPAVVWFGEALPREALDAALDATRCDVFMSVGTSAVVEPAASLARIAQSCGAKLLEINPEPTPLSPRVDLLLQEPAARCLPRLLAALDR